MKVLHIITGLSDGGAEAVLYRLCCQDTADQHTVISLMDEGKYGPLLREAGVTVHCLRMPRGRVRVAGLWRLWRHMRRQRPELIQTWMYHADLLGGLVGRLAGVPVVWGIHHTTLEPGKSGRATIWIAQLLARFSWVLPRRIAVCAQRAVAVHGSLGYDTSRMVVIPNGYDLEQFAPNNAGLTCLRAEWEVADDVPLLGMVGRYNPQKDHANLLSALAKLRDLGEDFNCVLVGAGLSEDNLLLVQQLEHAGLREKVRLLGGRNDIPAVMNTLDVHLLSSAYGEAFPNVLAEAMACGTPCVSTDVGDAALIVGETGWVVPPVDADAFAGGIRAALREWRDKERWRSRQQAARRRVAERFSLQAMVAAYRELWHTVIPSARAR